jgi:hypothetical protein
MIGRRAGLHLGLTMGWIAGLLLAGLTLSSPALAARKKISLIPQAKPTPPEEALHAYVEHVRAQQAAEVKTPGSIWSPEGRLVRLGTDAKGGSAARRGFDRGDREPGCLDGWAGEEHTGIERVSGLTSLFGALKTSNALQNLVGMTAASGLRRRGRALPTPAWQRPLAVRWWMCCPTECWWCRRRGS